MLISGDRSISASDPSGYNILYHQGLLPALDHHLGEAICGLIDKRDSSSIHFVSGTEWCYVGLLVYRGSYSTTEDEQCERWFNQNTSCNMDGGFMPVFLLNTLFPSNKTIFTRRKIRVQWRPLKDSLKITGKVNHVHLHWNISSTMKIVWSKILLYMENTNSSYQLR